MSEEFYEIMSDNSDRLRLKDKIVSNVAKAIKAIQQISHTYGESGLVLSNSDWQCHKLCENLDHALLHGLRHITNGYWKVVTEYTRKGTVKEILRYSKVTTNLGRGRAWLYLSLNDCLLESYIRCLMQDTKQIKKFYVKEALLLDEQRMNVLLTLTAGLDFVTFQLEPNVPYLDLGTSPPKQTSAFDRDGSQDDRVSLHSMDSVSSKHLMETSVSTPDSSKVTDSDNCSLSSLDTTNGSTSTDKSRQCSLSFDSGCHLDNIGIRNRQTSITPPTDTVSVSSQGETESRLKRIESIPVIEDVEEMTNEFEIIRVKSKGGKSKSSKKKKTKASISQTIKPQVNTKLEENNNDNVTVAEINISMATTSLSDSTNDIVQADTEVDICATELQKHIPQNLSENENVCPSLHEILEDENEMTKTDNSCALQESVNSTEQFNNDKPSVTDGAEIESVMTDMSVEIPALNNVILTDLSDNVSHNPPLTNIEPHSAIESMPHADLGAGCSNLEDSLDGEEDLYERYQSSSVENVESSQSSLSTSQQRKLALDDYVKFISGESSSEIVDTSGFAEEDDSIVKDTCDIDYSLNIDNNLMLHVMLDIFQDEDENYIKMFSCRQGQTEGDVSIIYVLITDRRIYLLNFKNSSKKFTIQTTVTYQDIDFIVHSINYQIVNVVCTNKRNQFWLTTGDEVLSRLIVDTMSEAVDNSNLKIRKLAIFDDATTQRICLKKYIVQECHCEASEVKLEIYSLVYWEDPHSRLVRKSESCSKEGKLLQRIKDPQRGLIWKSVYVVLRDGILCVFTNKSDSKPESYLRMGGDQCVGCRRSTKTNKPYCMEIVLANGDAWYFAMVDNAELCDWSMCMCRAVSEGMQEDKTPYSCLPCCVVVTDQKILMCHEDIQTSFFRTLGSANIEDITGLTLDTADTTYCVLEFESQDESISSEEWILYFNSLKEREKFYKALSSCWSLQFQVDLPVNSFTNITLQKRCLETSKLLRTSLLL